MDSKDDSQKTERSKRCIRVITSIPNMGVKGALIGLWQRGLLQAVKRPDGQIGYGLTDEARAMLKQINAEDGHDVDDVG